MWTSCSSNTATFQPCRLYYFTSVSTLWRHKSFSRELKVAFSRELRQEERCSVKQLFSRGDLLALFHTGFGKSLIFQVLAPMKEDCYAPNFSTEKYCKWSNQGFLFNGDFGWLVVWLSPIRHQKWKIPSVPCFSWSSTRKKLPLLPQKGKQLSSRQSRCHCGRWVPGGYFKNFWMGMCR